MSKPAIIKDGYVNYILYNHTSAEDAYSRSYARNIRIEDIPDHVGIGWIVDDTKSGDSRFIAPNLSDGWYWDSEGNPYNALDSCRVERECRMEKADADVLEAYRAKRAGDTSIDWDSWIDTLENYVAEVRATIGQPGYPLVVVYPEYPTKPTK